MTRVSLAGCTPEPMAAYLKSLAVLRLVTEQEDPGAKGCWSHEAFCLDSSLDEATLVRFFMDRYRPTPIVAPWNGGSGFYDGDNAAGIDAIRSSPDPRFEPYRRVIASVEAFPELPRRRMPLGTMLDYLEAAAAKKRGAEQASLREMVQHTRALATGAAAHCDGQDPIALSVEDLKALARARRGQRPPTALADLVRHATKIRTQAKRLSRKLGKPAIVQACRDRLEERALAWVDAAVALGSDGELAFPPLLGSGGNEGHLDYMNAFMTRIAELLIPPARPEVTEALLTNALFGTPAAGLSIVPVGQHNPGRAWKGTGDVVTLVTQHTSCGAFGRRVTRPHRFDGTIGAQRNIARRCGLLARRIAAMGAAVRVR